MLMPSLSWDGHYQGQVEGREESLDGPVGTEATEKERQKKFESPGHHLHGCKWTKLQGE